MAYSFNYIKAKVPVFRVTQSYLNLLVKQRIFFRFSGENIILWILKGEMPFKMHKIRSFSRKKIIEKICVPILPKIFRLVTPNTFIFLFGSIIYQCSWKVLENEVIS